MKRLFTILLALALSTLSGVAQNTIRIQTAGTASGDTGSFTVVMRNASAVNGVNIILRYEPDVIRPILIKPAGRASFLNGCGGSLFGGDRISFLAFDGGGALLGIDSGAIFEVDYVVADSIRDSTATTLTFTDGLAADSNLAILPFDYVDGIIPVSPMVGVDAGGSGLPNQYVLFQNFPNPFNPSTTIRYAVPRQSLVTITVYNLLGQKVSVLLNDVVAPGTHSITWDAAAMPAGVYFCRLMAGGYSRTIKLMLLK